MNISNLLNAKPQKFYNPEFLENEERRCRSRKICRFK